MPQCLLRFLGLQLSDGCAGFAQLGLYGLDPIFQGASL